MELLNGKLPLDENGEATALDNGVVIKTSLASFEYTTYEFTINDITSDLYDVEFVISGYAVTNMGAVYYQEQGMSTEVIGTSYNQMYKENEEE